MNCSNGICKYGTLSMRHYQNTFTVSTRNGDPKVLGQPNITLYLTYRVTRNFKLQNQVSKFAIVHGVGPMDVPCLLHGPFGNMKI